MNFKDIKQWSVSNGVATPVNPYEFSQPDADPLNKIEAQLHKSRARILRLKYESIKMAHTYATNAPDDVWDAEMFGKVVWQYKDYDTDWKEPKDDLKDDRRYTNTMKRQFLPFHPQPVEEKESEKMKTGVELITIKREKQVTKHGYNTDHDKQHTVRDFLDCAYTYMYIQKAAWPFDDGLRFGDEIENLTNAGAMICAAIDLIQGQGIGKNNEDTMSPESEKINDLERIIEYSADELGLPVSVLKNKALEWAKDDPLSDPDFEDRNT